MDRVFIDERAKKYLGEDDYPDKVPDAERVDIAIKPEHCATMGCPRACLPARARVDVMQGAAKRR